MSLTASGTYTHKESSAVLVQSVSEAFSECYLMFALPRRITITFKRIFSVLVYHFIVQNAMQVN